MFNLQKITSYLKRNKKLQKLGKNFFQEKLWSLEPSNVPNALAIGIFVAFIPTPMQMLIAASLAIYFKANIPISVSLVWITNPVTAGPIFYACYLFGKNLINNVREFYPNFLYYTDSYITPLYFGSLTVGITLGFVFFILAKGFYYFKK
jgi:uncharacterized protein (DUF2062 family)